MIELSLFGVLCLLFLGRLLSLDRPAALDGSWQMTLHIFPLLMSIGLVWSAYASHAGGIEPPTLVTQAVDATGQPVATTVVLEPDDERRIIRRIPLEAEKNGAVELALLVLLLSGLALLIGHYGRGRQYSAWCTTANLVACLSLLACLLQGPSSGAGEAAIRTFLATFPTDTTLTSFTVPDGTWRFERPFVVPTILACVACVLSLTFSRMPQALSQTVPLERVAALVCVAAVIMQGIGTHGFPFRPLEVTLMTSLGVLASISVYAETMPTRLLGFGAVVASLSFVVS
ncbi:MAG: hypothetical protein VX589_09340 [Myxococcota bacterium]|nr:hypothetical protein [Myxococcota bacterium]